MNECNLSLADMSWARFLRGFFLAAALFSESSCCFSDSAVRSASAFALRPQQEPIRKSSITRKKGDQECVWLIQEGAASWKRISAPLVEDRISEWRQSVQKEDWCSSTLNCYFCWMQSISEIYPIAAISHMYSTWFHPLITLREHYILYPFHQV